ncbi:Ubiquitin carboxyl-terminal hydrolase-like protein [Hapsidospora chrysogenum ATCC 11550]|uniref:Ubiquitin carboxyl-terminal hydrolase n=1 Tax=Hapsidospora chrysogenum (strain ATCC 11550 / CBS 779.69 / DSM 880 / IAM 14645 / JCM 23072 / IMI 49137) TaxID=857340 RepID=A0A086SVX9_HAPC1|nr:Ubiquitin carboxyl-terminal hydrolase-like protein [Hapsidospora chrysogenum ATCC 11550]
MASINVVVKHQGKKYDVEVDPSSTGEDFKLQLFSLTNVEPERQKILIKGGQLKDDADMGKLGLKAGQNIMMMGTPGSGGGDLVRPKEAVRFVEDMTEAEQAQQAGATPAGLTNLGNTCYLNSTLQTLRSIPELQTALETYKPSSSGLASGMTQMDLAAQLSALYKQMGSSLDAFPPMSFLTALRVVFPQFAEKSKSGHGYAQQDAEEAWSQIVQQLGQKVKIKESEDAPEISFVDKYMAGEFSSELACDEEEARNGGEKTVVAKDTFYKLNCHIDGQTNHLRDGIISALEEKLEKKSEVLGRDAVYTKKSKISRAPKYLTVHFVRFFWKRETQKKAKIMRKVTFPQELDIVEFCSDDLKKALVPVRDKVREIRKDEEDIQRARKRRKRSHEQDVGDIPGGAGLPSEKEKREKEKKEKEKAERTGKKEAAAADADTVMGEGETYKTDAEIDAEREAALLQAKKELNALIDPALRNDDGANQSGLYELRGVVTHQGGSADSGHYTAYVKKSAYVDPKTGKKTEEDGTWWWFNDDRVTEVPGEKIDTLAGGGESHSALILLYKAIPLPSAEGVFE